MTSRLARPWSGRSLDPDLPFGPSHCLLSEVEGAAPRDLEHTVLLNGSVRGQSRKLLLHPYPKRQSAASPARVGFPVRLRSGQEPSTASEVFAQEMLRRMNEVLARIQELEEALDDPANLWSRLRAAWKRAEDEKDPRMAEIVRQSRELRQPLRDLERRIRRVLRRHRQLTPLDRVQEMDRASMRWLSRQPGRTIAERAGAGQRILATVRKENYDTLENRVLHAYARLAADVAREWMQEHPRAKGSTRYSDVETFRKTCRELSRTLQEHGVAVAPAGITPNYVLMQDKGYRVVREAWELLLRREKVIDDLWAWQAQTWTDFAALAIVLAIDELEEAELIAQSPILWRSEAVVGRWFDQDRPLAVFWLRETGRIVEVQSRPENPGSLLTLARAHVSLKITDPSRGELPRRVAVWTPHAAERIDLSASLEETKVLLEQLQQVAANEILRNGLIITPAHERPEAAAATGRRVRVDGVALDASGVSLGQGLEALRAFARSGIYGDAV